MIISYYFPPWLAARMIKIIVKRFSQGRPCMSLRLLRVLLDDLSLFIYYAGRPKSARFLIDQDADREYEDKYFNSAIGACWEMAFQKVPFLPPSTSGGSTEETDS
jgi:hypothetical protein